MPIDPEAWPVLSQLMDEWMDLPEERRAEWLAAAEAQHGGAIPMLRELLSLPKPGFLETLPRIAEEGDSALAGSIAPGTLAGPYRLERELGRGGMGVVWLATRADGAVKRQVAIKFPFLHLPHQSLSDRFSRERDILASLEDARIARLYDAGMTADGRPYLVLEYVEGKPITAYCDRLALDIRARLALFLEVLAAVQYAHSNLVVHRDLKPSNILVTNAGQVRLLDFGIAKFLEQGEASETELTRSGGRALTPDYASPEQIEGRALTTATDVYSLGVLLYQLLTGSRPYSSPGAPRDLAARMRIEDPIRPSQAASADETQAHCRGGVTAKNLAAALRGDLDTILLKAVQRDPQARYPTADAFAQDLRRYLSGQPIQARPESSWYRARKFVSRNRLAVAATLAIGAALTAGAGIAVWQGRRAVQEKRRADTEAATARAVSDFLQKDLLSQAGSQTQAGGGARPDPDIKIRTALDRAVARLDGKFARQPAVEAAIRQTVGDSYLQLGLYAESERQMDRALGLRRRVLGARDPETLKSMQALAEVYQSQGKYSDAESLLKDLLQVERATGKQESREALDAMHSLAVISTLGHVDYRSAESQYLQVLDVQRRVLGENDAATVSTMNDLAAVLTRESKFAQAEELYRKVVEIRRRTLGSADPSTLTTLNGLGVLYRNEGKYTEAEPVFQEALNGRRRSMGEKHRDTLSSMNGLGMLYMFEGRNAEAESLLLEAAQTSAAVLGPDTPDAQSSLTNLAELYRRENKLKPAEAAYTRLLDSRLRTYGADNGYTANTEGALGDVRFQLHAYAGAAAMLRRAVDHYHAHQIDTWRRYFTECLLGSSLAAQGDPEGKTLLADSFARLLQRQDSVPPEYRMDFERARQLAGNGAKPH
jgi:serine/threonine protein kinase/Tfp pilus assembly protein PilF